MSLLRARLRRTGASAVEFALTLPVLVTLLSAVADYGWYFFQRTTVVNVARDATRLGVVVPRSSVPGPTNLTRTYAFTMLGDAGFSCPGSGCSVICNQLTPPGAGLILLQTRIRYEFQPLVGLVPIPSNMEAEFAMALEDQPSPLDP